MTTCLFGGAFDPPHNGHVALVEAALAYFQPERLVVVVTGNPPHKAVASDASTRLELAAAAFGGIRRVEVSGREAEREGPSYTVDTVRWAAGLWPDLVLLIGADQLVDFPTWKDPDDILARARLGGATRPDYPRERVERAAASLGPRARVELFDIPEVPVSSTEIRARLRRGEPIDDLVPPRVARLVEELGLYR